LLEQLQIEASRMDERTHVHHLEAETLRSITGVSGARSAD
jgi:hypothetical protein